MSMSMHMCLQVRVFACIHKGMSLLDHGSFYVLASGLSFCKLSYLLICLYTHVSRWVYVDSKATYDIPFRSSQLNDSINVSKFWEGDLIGSPRIRCILQPIFCELEDGFL